MRDLRLPWFHIVQKYLFYPLHGVRGFGYLAILKLFYYWQDRGKKCFQMALVHTSGPSWMLTMKVATQTAKRKKIYRYCCAIKPTQTCPLWHAAEGGHLHILIPKTTKQLKTPCPQTPSACWWANHGVPACTQTGQVFYPSVWSSCSLWWEEQPGHLLPFGTWE